MRRFFRILWRILFQFRHYKPQPVTLRSCWRWLSPYPSSIRRTLFGLLDHIQFISERETEETLYALNNEIVEKLAQDGVGFNRIIYLSIDKAGSSSPVMLSLLRDKANLERRRAKLIDSYNVKELNETTTRIQTGAIIYVDDFSGTGTQFVENREWIADFIVGNFSEFFLAPCMCEEGQAAIKRVGVIPVTQDVHYKVQRPLHEDSTVLNEELKNELTMLCEEMHPDFGLGYKKMATMVVYYRNAPNTMPLIFRGNLKQNPKQGIFPRTDDLPY